MPRNLIFTLIISAMFFTGTVKSDFTGSIDLERFCKTVYELYQTDEVQAKKELFVFKKINELIGSSQTVKVVSSDSITYDRKEDLSAFKSREIYYSDNKQGYFGVFVVATKKGDELLMKCTPEKEITINGKIADVIVLEYIKSNLNQKCYTSLKDFDDKGTVIQKILLKIEM